MKLLIPNLISKTTLPGDKADPYRTQNKSSPLCRSDLTLLSGFTLTAGLISLWSLNRLVHPVAWLRLKRLVTESITALVMPHVEKLVLSIFETFYLDLITRYGDTHKDLLFVAMLESVARNEETVHLFIVRRQGRRLALVDSLRGVLEINHDTYTLQVPYTGRNLRFRWHQITNAFQHYDRLCLVVAADEKTYQRGSMTSSNPKFLSLSKGAK